MKRRIVVKEVEKNNYSLLRYGSKHDIYVNPEGDEIPIPRHSDINEYLAKAIIKQARGE